MEVGFLGLGIMGKAMSLNLLRHVFEVTVWNRTLSKVVFDKDGILEQINNEKGYIDMSTQLLPKYPRPLLQEEVASLKLQFQGARSLQKMANL
ncbi:hypothetical protein K1719_042131 [Acacia pycnantha]|nr:hypothetical protein K1719_042131 [Acacia pycnantha]